MAIYIVLLLLILCLGKSIKKNQYNVWDFILIVILITIAGIRYGIGTDYTMYSNMYFHPTQANYDKVEIGFKWFIQACNFVFGDVVWAFFLLCSALTIIPIYVTIKKYATKPGEAIFYFVALGFYTLTFNMVRQSIAMAITIFALRYMFEKKAIKYILCVGIASLFHTTAIIMIPMYWLSKIKLTKKQLYLLGGILLSLGTLAVPIFNFAITNIPQYAMYEAYAEYSDIESGIGTFLVSGVYIILICFAIAQRKKIVKLNENYYRIINLAVISIFFIALSLKNTLFARMIYYLLIPLVLILPEYISAFKEQNRKYVQFFIIIACMVFYMMNIYFFNGVYPYNHILG